MKYFNSNPDSHNSCRLNKFLATAGICSRRKADELIFTGHVKVNNAVITNPAFKVSEKDNIFYDGKPVTSFRQSEYIIINKPIHVVSTLKDPQNRTIITDLLPANLQKLRLFPVGRLDYFSEGLLLLTNDGELANRLMHPRYAHHKIYNVKIRGKIVDKQLAVMCSGMKLADGTQLLPIEAKRKYESLEFTILEIKLREGKNRQIRKMCEKLGLVILSLKRISEGVLELGSLPPGKWRKLSPAEIVKLKKSAGL